MQRNGLRIAVVTAFPSEDWHSARLIAACLRVGEVVTVDPACLSAQLRGGEARVTVGEEPARGFDAFLLARGLSPRGDADVQFALYRALEEQGAVVVNRIGPLLDAQDKFRTSLLLKREGVPTPRAAVAQSGEEAGRLVRSMGEAVLKPLSASLGEGVERVSGPEGEARAARRVAEEGAIYLQAYVPNPGRDVRVFVVGGRVEGAVERLAPPGEFRTNVARGGRARPVALSKAAARAAVAASAALGLDYSGVDVVEGPDGPQVIEVNGNPSFDMIFDACGLDMAEPIARYVAERAQAARERREEATGSGVDVAPLEL